MSITNHRAGPDDTDCQRYIILKYSEIRDMLFLHSLIPLTDYNAVIQHSFI